MRSCSFSAAGVVRDGPVRLDRRRGRRGIAAVWKRPMSPQPASVRCRAQQQRRPQPKAGGSFPFRAVPLAHPRQLLLQPDPERVIALLAFRDRCTLSGSIALVPAQHFDLPGPDTSIRGPGRASTQPRTRIRRFSRDLSAMPADSTAGILRLEIVTAKSRVQLRPKFR